MVGIRIGHTGGFTVADDKGNSWAIVEGTTSVGVEYAGVWRAKNCAGGATVVTITPAGSASIRGSLFEISGENTTEPTDQHVNATGVSGAGSSGNITSTASGMWVGLVALAAGSAVTPGTLGTATGTVPTGGSSTKTAMMYHNESGAQTGSANFTFTADSWTTIVASFLDAAGVSIIDTSMMDETAQWLDDPDEAVAY